jgi:hypothetical protein
MRPKGKLNSKLNSKLKLPSFMLFFALPSLGTPGTALSAGAA